MAAALVETLRARAPLTWDRISTDSRPDVSLMILLLTDMGVQLQARPSGSACLKVLVDNLEFIEARLRDAQAAEPPPPAPQPPSAPEPPHSPPSRSADALISPNDFDASMQCENTLLAEAHERMVACVLTSFRTDAGLIMLENELSLFEDEAADEVASWVVNMRDTWSSRLHSKVLEDFYEALDLWVLSQRKLIE